METLPRVVLQRILDHVERIEDKLSLMTSCKLFEAEMVITEAIKGDISRITDRFLAKHRYLRRLDASYNPNITGVNHLLHLKELYARGDKCGLGDDGVKGCVGLRLLEVGTRWRDKADRIIPNTNLKITDAGIRDLTKLRVLRACDAVGITNVDHLPELEELDISGDCGVADVGRCFGVRSLRIGDNLRITALPSGLRRLWADGDCDVDLTDCPHLEFLDVGMNPLIDDVNHLGDLQTLYACGRRCALGDKGIEKIRSRLKDLWHLDNDKITENLWAEWEDLYDVIETY